MQPTPPANLFPVLLFILLFKLGGWQHYEPAMLLSAFSHVSFCGHPSWSSLLLSWDLFFFFWSQSLFCLTLCFGPFLPTSLPTAIPWVPGCLLQVCLSVFQSVLLSLSSLLSPRTSGFVGFSVSVSGFRPCLCLGPCLTPAPHTFAEK